MKYLLQTVINSKAGIEICFSYFFSLLTLSSFSENFIKMTHYDRTCNSIEERSFLNYYKDILKKPEPCWHFDRHEINAIAVIYYKLLCDAGCDMKQSLPTKSFDTVLHKAFGMADDSLVLGIFSALNGITNVVTLKQWIYAMSLFLRGTLEEHIEYCFKVYDMSERRFIRRELMIYLMRNFVFNHNVEDSKEAVKDLVDLIFTKMDIDRDGMISFEDYKQTVLKKPMLLECFGQCLPDKMSVYTFLMTFTEKIKFT